MRYIHLSSGDADVKGSRRPGGGQQNNGEAEIMAPSDPEARTCKGSLEMPGVGLGLNGEDVWVGVSEREKRRGC